MGHKILGEHSCKIMVSETLLILWSSAKKQLTSDQSNTNRKKELDKLEKMGKQGEFLCCEEENITGKYITCITYVSPPDLITGFRKKFC